MKVPDYDREDPGELEQISKFLQKVGEKTGVEASANLEPLLERLSRQVEYLTQALTRRLTSRDNFNTDVRKVSFKNNEPRILRPDINGEVKEVRIRQTFPRGRAAPKGTVKGGDTAFLVPRMLDWATTGRGEITVVVKWDTAPVDPIEVELAIEGD